MNAQLVIAHQLQGAMLHHDLMLMYTVLGKPFKCREQKWHYYHELKNFDRTNFAVIKQTGAIVDPGPLTRIKLPEVKASMTEDQKSAACKTLLDEWYKWEKATCDFYREQLGTDPENKWLKYLMREAAEEVHHIEKMMG